MTNDILPLVTVVLIIFAVLFAVSGVFLTLWQYLRYRHRSKLYDIEHGAAGLQPTLDACRQRQLRDYTRIDTADSIIPHTPSSDLRRKYNAKPLPLLPLVPSRPARPARLQKPTATARSVPPRGARKPIRLGLALRTDLFTPPPSLPQPSALEQSQFSSDDEDDDGNRDVERKSGGRVKSWFPPRPLWLRASHLQSPVLDTEMRRVSSGRPQIMASASRFSQRVSQRISQSGRPSTVRHVESAEVPIVSTPRDLRIDSPSPPRRTLASPFQYHARQSIDKRDTFVGPGDSHRDHHHHHDASHDHVQPSRELPARQASARSNII